MISTSSTCEEPDWGEGGRAIFLANMGEYMLGSRKAGEDIFLGYEGEPASLGMKLMVGLHACDESSDSSDPKAEVLPPVTDPPDLDVLEVEEKWWGGGEGVDLSPMWPFILSRSHALFRPSITCFKLEFSVANSAILSKMSPISSTSSTSMLGSAGQLLFLGGGRNGSPFAFSSLRGGGGSGLFGGGGRLDLSILVLAASGMWLRGVMAGSEPERSLPCGRVSGLRARRSFPSSPPS